MLLIGMIAEQTAEVCVGGRRMLSLGRIANAHCTGCKVFVSRGNKNRRADVSTIVFAGTAFTRDKNDELSPHRCFWEAEQSYSSSTVGDKL